MPSVLCTSGCHLRSAGGSPLALPVGLNDQEWTVWGQWCPTLCDPARRISYGWWYPEEQESRKASRWQAGTEDSSNSRSWAELQRGTAGWQPWPCRSRAKGMPLRSGALQLNASSSHGGVAVAPVGG
jgi:hypothetical protein